MTVISINPTEPEEGQATTVTVGHSDCNPFTIRVVLLGAIPPTVVEQQDGNSNPPPANMTFVPQTPGNYRVEVECNGQVTAREGFTVT